MNRTVFASSRGLSRIVFLSALLFDAQSGHAGQSNPSGSETCSACRSENSGGKSGASTEGQATLLGPIPFVTTERGPTTAPVTIIEFSDFQCPFCTRVNQTLNEIFQSYPDKVRLLFKQAPLPIHPKSHLVHEAVLAAGAQGKFWPMHDLVFANQQKAERSDLIQFAKELGLDIQQFEQALARQSFKPLVDRDLAEAKALGITGTPTFFINGRKLVGAQRFESFKAAIDEALGLTPPNHLPSRPVEINISKASLEGSPDAPVSLVVFSDFQCPYCSGLGPTLHQLVAQNPGKVKVAFKHFPLDFHRDAPLAHEAVLAAEAQGKFWPMHDWIFAHQQTIKRDDLLKGAKELGLDATKFTADLDSGRFKGMVEADKEEGRRVGVNGTPTLFINGKLISGGRSLGDLTRSLQAELQPKAVQPQVAAAVPAVGKGKPVDAAVTKGPANAPVTILWFADLQSPLSAKASQLMDQAIATFPSNVRVVFKHRPISELHPEAPLAHEATLAAGAQGKFWAMQEIVLANQTALQKDSLVSYARRIGLDAKPFSVALESRAYRLTVEADLEEASRRGVRGSPVFFINNKRIDGLQPLARLQSLIEVELKSPAVAAK